MTTKHKFTSEEAREMGGQLGVNQSVVDFAEFRRELKIELEHGFRVLGANSDAPLTGKIAWAHLKEFPDSNTRWNDSKPKRMSLLRGSGRSSHQR